MTRRNDWSTEDEEIGDSWKLDDAEIKKLYEKTLDELIELGYAEGQVSRIPIRSFPLGLRSWWNYVINVKSDLSLSKLHRITFSHGLSIVYRHQDIKEMTKLYYQKLGEAERNNDQQMIKILEDKVSPSGFMSKQDYSTSVGSLSRLDGPIARLTTIIGMPTSRLVLFLSIESMMTLKDSKWKNLLESEHGLFWRCVRDRLNQLGGEIT